MGRGWVSIRGKGIYNSLGYRGQWAVYYTGPQSFMITFSYSLALQLWGLLLKFDWLVHQVECPNVSTTNYKLQKG